MFNKQARAELGQAQPQLRSGLNLDNVCSDKLYWGWKFVQKTRNFDLTRKNNFSLETGGRKLKVETYN